MLNAQSLRHHSMLAKIGRAMREAVNRAADLPLGAQATVRNAKGRVTLVVHYSRVLGGLRSRQTGFRFFDFTEDSSPEVTPLVLSVLREHGDVADALPAKPAMVTPEDLPASLLLDLLPVDTHGREAFPYGRAALGIRADVPFTCGGAR
ncbi:hypothetical protein [Pseudomonas phage ZRG1]|nr:hypothetical protein [Pseudomonas phage ZRG1]